MEGKNDQELIASLENVMVKEFRTLQSLVNLTKDERDALTGGKTDTILRLVEEKEVILDQLSLLEDSRKNIMDHLAVRLMIDTQDHIIRQIFNRLDLETSQRLDRLNEGISALAGQARDLNSWNKAYSLSTLEWLDGAQAFLLKLFEPVDNYKPHKTGTDRNPPVSIDVSRTA